MDGFRRGPFTFPVADGGSGESVVLLHGFPQKKESLEPLAVRLQAAGYRTIRPDQRGYAPGARPHRRRDYRMSELAADVDALIRSTGDSPVHLVGHDWGAAVAWATAAEYPERVASLTALSVPHPFAMAAAIGTSRQLLASWYMYLFQLPWLPERLFSPHRPASRERMVRFLTSYGQTRDRAERDLAMLGRAGFSAALGWYRAMFLGSPAKLRARIRVPTLYVWSEGDTAITRAAASRCEAQVDASYEFVELDAASHWFPEEMPSRLARIILRHVRAHPVA
jgi:pimeloyl-ACP methyl ester carboxylesterase